jgi:hypothetical protein
VVRRSTTLRLHGRPGVEGEYGNRSHRRIVEPLDELGRSLKLATSQLA